MFKTKSIINISNIHSICIVTSNILYNLNIEIPELQRGKSDERIDILVKRELEYYEKYNTFNFCMSPIVLCQIGNKYFSIDGQHRLYCFRKIMELQKYNEFDILLSVFKVENEEQMNILFMHINESLPSPLMSNNLDKQKIINDISKYYETKYSEFMKTTTSPQKPNIQLQKFKEKITDLVDKTNNKDTILKYINNCNNKIKILFLTNKIIATKLQIAKCEKYNFWLGLVLDWEDPLYVVKEKQNIPPFIRSQTWEKYNPNKTKGICPICQKEIEVYNFDCGHIISEKNGGETNVDNLCPICHKCNLSMGSMNFDDYKKKHKIK